MKLPVIFKWETGDHPQVCAFFPTLPGDNDPSTMTCYAHVGQHSSADMDYVRSCRPASPEEYASLLSELQSVGYDGLVVMKRQSWKHYNARIAALSGAKAND